MYSRVITGAVRGIDSVLAAVEVDASKGMPGIEMVGQLDNAVREAKERQGSAQKCLCHAAAHAHYGQHIARRDAQGRRIV